MQVVEDISIESESSIEEESEKPLSFQEKFKTWDPDKALRVKDPRAKAYVLDQIFWNHPPRARYYKPITTTYVMILNGGEQ